jgi:hypothetical protein
VSKARRPTPSAVTLADIMGSETTLWTADGRITVDVSGDAIDLVGVGSELAYEAARPVVPLRVDRWRTRSDTGGRLRGLPRVHPPRPPDGPAGLCDHNIRVAPASKDGAPAFLLRNPAMTAQVVNPRPGHPPGIRSTLIARSCFWPNEATGDSLRQVCRETGGVFVDISRLSRDESHRARSERKFAHAGVAAHPGDKGMAAIADALWRAIRQHASRAAK